MRIYWLYSASWWRAAIFNWSVTSSKSEQQQPKKSLVTVIVGRSECLRGHLGRFLFRFFVTFAFVTGFFFSILSLFFFVFFISSPFANLPSSQLCRLKFAYGPDARRHWALVKDFLILPSLSLSLSLSFSFLFSCPLFSVLQLLCSSCFSSASLLVLFWFSSGSLLVLFWFSSGSVFLSVTDSALSSTSCVTRLGSHFRTHR